MNDDPHVRPELPGDRAAVWAVNASAFETTAEAGLVDALRAKSPAPLSLVAECQGAVVGHILFSPVSLAGHPELPVMGLAPMAVAPAYQRKGVGSALVRAGLAHCRRRGISAVVVLGYPSYYPRFGFQPAAHFGIGCEFDAPAEAFMLIELEPGALHGATGTIHFAPAFSDV